MQAKRLCVAAVVVAVFATVPLYVTASPLAPTRLHLTVDGQDNPRGVTIAGHDDELEIRVVKRGAGKIAGANAIRVFRKFKGVTKLIFRCSKLPCVGHDDNLGQKNKETERVSYAADAVFEVGRKVDSVAARSNVVVVNFPYQRKPSKVVVVGPGMMCQQTIAPLEVKRTCSGLTDERGPDSVLHVPNGATVKFIVRANALLPPGWSVTFHNGSVTKCVSDSVNFCTASMGPFTNSEAGVDAQLTVADDSGHYLGYQQIAFYIWWGTP